MPDSKKALFSILVANYNNGKFLPEAIESVIAQSYTNWEIIIVDDASTDDSHLLYEDLKLNNKIRVFLNGNNRGCGYTKARCVEEATGEFFAFLDPDDALAPNAIEVMVNEHIQHPKHSLIYSTHYLCDEHLNVVKTNNTIGQAIPLIFGSNKSISHFASFKNSFYEKVQPINKRLPRAVDMDLYYKISEVGDILYIDKPLYYYRRHNNGISSFGNALKAKYWHAVVVKNTCQRRIEKGIPTISKKEQEKYFYDYFIWKAMEKRQKHQYCKALFCVFQSCKMKPVDDIKLKLKLLLPFSKF